MSESQYLLSGFGAKGEVLLHLSLNIDILIGYIQDKYKDNYDYYVITYPGKPALEIHTRRSSVER